MLDASKSDPSGVMHEIATSGILDGIHSLFSSRSLPLKFDVDAQVTSLACWFRGAWRAFNRRILGASKSDLLGVMHEIAGSGYLLENLFLCSPYPPRNLMCGAQVTLLVCATLLVSGRVLAHTSLPFIFLLLLVLIPS
jgi:hypothetical protein